MRNGALIAVVGLALAGCAHLARINGFAVGPVGARAAPCEVAIADGPRDMFLDTRVARMKVGDGGWCGWAVRLVDQDGARYRWDRAIVARAPSHGEVRVRDGRRFAHIEYRPAPGYRGLDAFAVELAPGFALRRAEVRVVASAPGPAEPERVITSTRMVVPPDGWSWP